MKTFKLTMATVAVSLVLGVQAYAEQTNLVQNLNIRLVGIRQGETIDNNRYTAETVDLVRVDTRRVIEALGVATANSFSSTSKLVVVTPLGGGESKIQVRDGATMVDVTSFFAHADMSNAVQSSFLNKRNGRYTSTSYNIQHFALRDGSQAINLHFEVSGLTVEDANANGSTLDATVSGSGDRGGELMILHGSITVSGRRLEVVEDEWDPDIVS